MSTAALFSIWPLHRNLMCRCRVQGELLADLRNSGIIEMEKHCSEGTVVSAYVAKDSQLRQRVEMLQLSQVSLRDLLQSAS